MTTMSDLKKETTLAAIADDPDEHTHSHLFAIIIDVTEPKKGGKLNNYITKFKIIDPSFNYKIEMKNDKLKFHKFVHVNIYSEKPDDSPKVKNVGDIIRLRRFKFKYTEKGELMGNDLKFSNWLIYSATPENKDVSNSFKQFDKNHNRPLNDYEANRVSDLRKWSDTFFGNNSLIYISWWCGFKEVEESAKGQTVLNKVDLILKVKHVEISKKNKIKFLNRDNKAFNFFIRKSQT